MNSKDSAFKGVGLGLRRAFLDELVRSIPAEVDFFEVAPENWIKLGGKLGRKFTAVAATLPLICHGLSLNLGGHTPLDPELLFRLRHFLEVHQVRCYSEHLSYCADAGHLYELLPIPFTSEAVLSVAARIRRTQELLERRIAIENISYYCVTAVELTEIDFLNAVLSEADCDLMLDINNVYVNSVNNAYDPYEFLGAIPTERIRYGHVAGHINIEGGLKIDNHGNAVCTETWDLLEFAYRRHGVFPTVLERDLNFPPLSHLLAECRVIAALQAKHSLVT